VLRLWPSFSPNTLWVTFAADGLAIVQQTRGFNKRITDQQFIKTRHTEKHPAESPNWQLLVNQLDGYLSSASLNKNTQMNVILSSDYVRYIMLPAQQVAMNSAEKSAYVNAVFREIYGAAANDWYIKYHSAAPHQNTPAAAVDKQLLASLEHLAGKYQLKLNTVQPYLMAAFNALNHSIHKANGYLVLLENTKLLLIYCQQGVCQQLQTVTVNQDWQTALKNALNRELLLNEQLNTADKNLFIYAPAQKNTSLNAIDGWHVQRIGHANKAKLEAPFYMLESVL